jgi:hypothetical protein
LEPGEPAGIGVRRVLEEQRVRILDLLSHWEDEPALSVHRARQGCKRARAAAHLLKVSVPYAAIVENGFFREVHRRIGYARDNEALVEALDFLRTLTCELRLAESIEMLRDSCAARAAQNLRQNHAALSIQIDIAVEQLRRAEGRLARLPVADLRHRDLRRGARKTWKRCVAGYLGLKPDSLPICYHEWRRQVKYAWHQTRLLAVVRPHDAGELLDELSTTLGYCQDLELLDALLREQPDALGIDTHVQRLRHLIRDWRRKLRGRSLEIGRGLFMSHDVAVTIGPSPIGGVTVL